MSDALAMSLPQGAPSTGRNWVKANIIAALISAAASLAVLVVGYAFGEGKADAGVVARGIIVLTHVLASVATLAAYAVLAGAVLRQKLPRFPMRAWIVLHVAAGLLFGIYTGYGALEPPTDSNELTEQLASLPVMMGILFGGPLVGAIFGVVVGSFQALIMRRAARGLGAWIGFSVIAGMLSLTVVLTVAVLAFTALPQTLTDVMGEVMMLITTFFIEIIMAVVMLPAVARLTPR
jgi:hypothetical protein